MKCPNCGLEVVIATDMCPQCGYRHDFDGSILPSGGAAVHDGDSYGAGGEARCERRKRPRRGRAPHGGQPRAERREQAGGLSMRWYQFIVNVGLPIFAVYCFYRAVDGLAPVLSLSIVYSLPYSGLIPCAGYLAGAALAMAARRQLKLMRWSGAYLMFIAMILPETVNFALWAVVLTAAGFPEGLVSAFFYYLMVLLFAVFNLRYFVRRREMFRYGAEE